MKVIKKQAAHLNPHAFATNTKILNEVNIMKNLSHPNVLSLIDFYQSAENVLIIMEYLEGKDMLYRITQFDPNRKKLKEADAKFFFLQAVHGLKYLHDKFITHRDIKPDNIMLKSLTRDTILKISDFGLSKLIAADSMKTVCGTHLYAAPEIYSCKYDNKVDIWSLGCVLFAMLSGSVPFSGTNAEINSKIKAGKVIFQSSAWASVTHKAKDLITKMLKKDPNDRPSVNEILVHPWLQCEETKSRVNRLHALDDTLMNSSNETELDLTLLNVTLDESIRQPPAKRMRFN